MLKIEFFTVLSLIFSVRETSRLLIPSATSREISSSRRLSRALPVTSATRTFDFERPSKINGKSAGRTHTSPRDTQVDALCELVKILVAEHNPPRTCPERIDNTIKPSLLQQKNK